MPTTFAANPRKPAQTRTFPRNATRKFGLVRRAHGFAQEVEPRRLCRSAGADLDGERHGRRFEKRRPVLDPARAENEIVEGLVADEASAAIQLSRHDRPKIEPRNGSLVLA